MQWVAQSRGIILASSSPRRKELFELAGLPFQIQIADIDETPIDNESARDLVQRLALQKAERVAKDNPNSWVIGADTVVAVDGTILGKPADREDAKRMLLSLAGRKHEVLGGVSLVCSSEGASHVWLSVSEVEFYPLSDELVVQYVSTDEPYDKAGGYAIQGVAGQFVKEVSGSYSNIVGLDIAALVQRLYEQGIVGVVSTSTGDDS